MFEKLIVRLHSRLSTRGEEGATAAEYGLLISLIALAIIGAAEALGFSIRDLFQEVADTL